MKSYSRRVTERAQPWLGTLVSIRVGGLPPAEAHAAISAAFEEIGLVHRLMSFHRSESDVGHLNRYASLRRVNIHPYTFEVLNHAIELSAATNGCFDVSVAAELVRWGWLPAPPGGGCAHGTWEDVELNPDGTVGFRRPLWIDLGGIAKGYAVDRAAIRLREHGVSSAAINAGGDIRVLGERPEQIALAVSIPAGGCPVLELADGSVASSSGQAQCAVDKPSRGPHVDGTDRSPTVAGRFVCVLAEDCMVADALTKVVMANGPDSAAVMRQFGASAHVFDTATGWQSINEGRCAA